MPHPTPPTHALLVADVVDSTKLAEDLGDAKVAELWAAHDRVARDLLATHKGREIDKTDGFLLLFDEAKDAVAYALAYHAALKGLALRARAGLHVGEVVLRENSPADIARGAKPLEVEGIAKPTAARVMSVAQGGQTLLSPEARDALGDVELRIESHGHWRMKGISEPIELFEAGDADAPFTPPPDGAKVYRVVRQGDLWLPVKEVKHSLPRERDAFVGREEDLHALAGLLEQGAALVCVLGIGGTGKTRLVTHFGWTWLGDWPGGVWFCDLSEARSADGIAYAVATALDVPLGKQPVVQLGHAIAARGRCLVILDNFEQVARHAQETLGKWLDRAADAQFVVTTREVLGLRGETALALAPLEEREGVALFVARAHQAKRDFVADDPASIEALVTLLDGLPLAIELAAARVRLIPPKTLLARMSQRFKLLTSSGGRRDRQATLRGALDWSWDLLSEDEQASLAQVSVFEGGFTLEAAAAVLDLEELWPEDAVQALLDKSLLRRVSDERLDLLVSVQEYAAEKLDGLGQRRAAESRHGAWCAGFGGEEALSSLGVHGGVARRWALSAELGNLVAATRRAVARSDSETAAATLNAAWVLLRLRGPYVVAVDLASAALALPDLALSTRAALATALGQALAVSGRATEARAHFEQALETHREVGDRGAERNVLGNLGSLHWSQGRVVEARAHYEQALAIAREVGNRRSEGKALGNLGALHYSQGRMDEARAHYEQALAIHREVGNRGFEGHVLGSLGGLHHAQGRHDEARAEYVAGEALLRAVENADELGKLLCGRAQLEHAEGHAQAARAALTEAEALAVQVGAGEGSELAEELAKARSALETP